MTVDSKRQRRRGPSLRRRLERVVTAPYRWSRDLLHFGLIAGRRFLRIALSPAYALIEGVRWTGAKIVHWWTSREMRHLIFGLPVLGLAVGAGYLAVACHLRASSDVLGAYLHAARHATSQNDWRSAAILWDRVLAVGGENSEGKLNLAVAVANNGDVERYHFLMSEIAPVTRPVFAPAHLLEAKRLLAPARISTDDLKRAETQLLHAVFLEPQNAEERAILGQLYMSTGRPKDAQEHLEIAVAQAPGLSLSLAKSYALTGDARRTERYGKLAAQFYHRQVDRDPLNRQARLNWAESLSILEEYARSLEVLNSAATRSDDPAYRRAAARVYVAWADSLAKKGTGDVAAQFRLLEAGLRCDPNEMILFHRIMRLLRDQGRTAEDIRGSLVATLARGEAQVLMHLLLGTEAGERGQLDQALHHLKRAHELDPNTSAIANNLAWYMSHSDQPDLNAALALIEFVIQRFPNTPEFRDTRGEILMKLERWEEAQQDFEAALPAMPGNRTLHASLARVYRELNQRELAAAHERLAATLDSEPASPAK